MENVIIDISDNQPKNEIIETEQSKEEAKNLLREKRDVDLKETDKYFSISDATYPNIDMIDLKNYRQQLRDITKYARPTIDIGGNLVIDYYPTKPKL
tara:strand:- start:329 stop:619 length:291 start_codon:yes stop_codon:yes gene_type:complete